MDARKTHEMLNDLHGWQDRLRRHQRLIFFALLALSVGSVYQLLFDSKIDLLDVFGGVGIHSDTSSWRVELRAWHEMLEMDDMESDSLPVAHERAVAPIFEAHWMFSHLKVAVSLNSLAVLTWLVRFGVQNPPFFKFYLFSILFFLASCAVQLLALGVRAWILLFDWSLLSYVNVMLNLFLLLLEMDGLIITGLLRSLYVKLSHKRKRLINEKAPATRSEAPRVFSMQFLRELFHIFETKVKKKTE